MRTNHFLTLMLLGMVTINTIGATSGSAKVLASTSNIESEKANGSESKILEIITNETAEGKTSTIKWLKITNKNSQRIKKVTPSETETIIGLESTQKWTLKSDEKQMTVLVDGKKAKIEVIKNNETTIKEINLGKNSILYPPSFYLKSFIKSDNKKMTAWSINRKDEKLRKMLFTKLGKETISIKNKSYDCIKVEMKPTGVAGMIWKAYYWFEIPSGRFIKYFGKKGPPGTPDYTIEISDETPNSK